MDTRDRIKKKRLTIIQGKPTGDEMTSIESQSDEYGHQGQTYRVYGDS